MGTGKIRKGGGIMELNPRADKDCKKCSGTGIQSGINLMPVEVVNYPCDCMKGVGVGKLIDAE